jgi:Transcriptional regulator
MARTGTGSRPPRKSPRGKREDILAVATTLFGRDGYEDSKWADVASAVGIGSTALYHYFDPSCTACT